MKTYYIKPNTKTYHEKVTVEDNQTAADALVKFSESMDSDAGAYFEAVEEKPVLKRLHSYDKPKNDVEREFNKIVALDKKSQQYNRKAVYGLQLYYDGISGLIADAEDESRLLYMLKQCKTSTIIRISGSNDKNGCLIAENALKENNIPFEWLDDGRLKIPAKREAGAFFALNFKAGLQYTVE